MPAPLANPRCVVGLVIQFCAISELATASTFSRKPFLSSILGIGSKDGIPESHSKRSRNQSIQKPGPNFTEPKPRRFVEPNATNKTAVPQWVRQSSEGPPTNWNCNHTISIEQFRGCTNERLENFRNFSWFLHDDPGFISQIFREAIYLGRFPHANTSCMQRFFQGHTVPPVRMVFDATYANTPRCCSSERLASLHTDSNGEISSATEQAMAKVPTLELDGVKYFRGQPQSGGCHKSDPCALVIELHGPQEEPWMQLQAQCPECAKSLKSVVISPTVELDSAGANVQWVDDTLLPFVWKLLNNSNGALDRERVYLVSKGWSNVLALHAVVRHHAVFSMVAMSGGFDIDKDLMRLFSTPSLINRASESRLKNIQVHIGDRDAASFDQSFWWNMKMIAAFCQNGEHWLNQPQLDLRIYPESEFPVWYATWNALHETIWTGERFPGDDNFTDIPTTCPSREMKMKVHEFEGR